MKMASGWVKSFHCKSRYDDVFHPRPKLLVPSYSCRSNSKSVKDVIEARRKPRPKTPEKTAHSDHPPPPTATTNTTSTATAARARRSLSTGVLSSARNPDALTELPQGHASRNVVEMIFHSGWVREPFPGRIEMIFKVQNGSRVAARFEEYRDSVRSRAASSLAVGVPTDESARCAADGNEMMRFYCLGATQGEAWGVVCGKGAVMCTYSTSGEAHERAGGGRGRKGMLVCRVIAGRVNRFGSDSVSGDNGELIVFDPRAVLPCFLIIYKL